VKREFQKFPGIVNAGMCDDPEPPEAPADQDCDTRDPTIPHAGCICRTCDQARWRLVSAHEPEASKPQFMECDACRAKAGSPTLCAGCLHNRRVIGQLSAPPVSPTARRCACDPLPPVRELWRVLPDELQGVANAALTAVLEHRCPDESDAYDPPRCAHAVPTDPANPCRGGLFHDFSRASPPPRASHPFSPLEGSAGCGVCGFRAGEHTQEVKRCSRCGFAFPCNCPLCDCEPVSASECSGGTKDRDCTCDCHALTKGSDA
jgi:hypothetical protein